MTTTEKFAISNLDKIMVNERYMELILKAEDFPIEDDYGVDSNMVCQYACDYLGFENLGDFDDGFIFVIDKSELNSELYSKYFNADDFEVIK